MSEKKRLPMVNAEELLNIAVQLAYDLNLETTSFSKKSI